MIRGAHDGAITAIEWVPGQPVLVTSGEDNSVKVRMSTKFVEQTQLTFNIQQWFFESPTTPPRLLKFRSGHHAPPHLIRYYGDDGKQLLTASRDRSLRCTSVVRDSRSFELSQGNITFRFAKTTMLTNLLRIFTEKSNITLHPSSLSKVPSSCLNILLAISGKGLGWHCHCPHRRTIRSYMDDAR